MKRRAQRDISISRLRLLTMLDSALGVSHIEDFRKNVVEPSLRSNHSVIIENEDIAAGEAGRVEKTIRTLQEWDDYVEWVIGTWQADKDKDSRE